MVRQTMKTSAAVMGILFSGMSLCFSASAEETEKITETETASAPVLIADNLEAKLTKLTLQENGAGQAEKQLTPQEFEKFKAEEGKTYKVSLEYEGGALELPDAALADWDAYGLELSEPAVRWIKAKKGLNMRRLPTTTSDPISSIPAGTEVKVIGTCSVRGEEDDGDWVLIEYNSQDVFVAGWHVTEDQAEAEAAKAAWEAEQAALAAQAAQAQSYSGGGSGNSGKKKSGKKSSGPSVVGKEVIYDCDTKDHGTIIYKWSNGKETYENF